MLYLVIFIYFPTIGQDTVLVSRTALLEATLPVKLWVFTHCYNIYKEKAVCVYISYTLRSGHS